MYKGSMSRMALYIEIYHCFPLRMASEDQPTRFYSEHENVFYVFWPYKPKKKETEKKKPLKESENVKLLPDVVVLRLVKGSKKMQKEKKEKLLLYMCVLEPLCEFVSGLWRVGVWLRCVL